MATTLGVFMNGGWQKPTKSSSELLSLELPLSSFQTLSKYRNRTRESMAPGCPEKFDWEFICWVLWKGRCQTALARYKKIRQTFPQKFYE